MCALHFVVCWVIRLLISTLFCVIPRFKLSSILVQNSCCVICTITLLKIHVIILLWAHKYLLCTYCHYYCRFSCWEYAWCNRMMFLLVYYCMYKTRKIEKTMHSWKKPFPSVYSLRLNHEPSFPPPPALVSTCNCWTTVWYIILLKRCRTTFFLCFYYSFFFLQKRKTNKQKKRARREKKNKNYSSIFIIHSIAAAFAWFYIKITSFW